MVFLILTRRGPSLKFEKQQQIKSKMKKRSERSAGVIDFLPLSNAFDDEHSSSSSIIYTNNKSIEV